MNNMTMKEFAARVKKLVAAREKNKNTKEQKTAPPVKYNYARDGAVYHPRRVE